ncbi:hypothetical protein Tco_0424403 [Tanacetum coccineum]
MFQLPKSEDTLQWKCKADPEIRTAGTKEPTEDCAVEATYYKCHDFVDVNESVSESVVEKPTVESNDPKTARKENRAPIIEDWLSKSEEEDMPKIKIVEMFNKPSKSIARFEDYEEIDGGFVAFGGNSKGGKITGKDKEIAKPITPPSESASEKDNDPEQDQRDKDTQKNLVLIGKDFKKIYKPTNNNLRTSSKSINKNVDTSPRYKNDNQTGQFRNQRTMTVVRAKETVGSQYSVSHADVDVDNFKRCCTSYAFDVGYKELRDFLLHCSSINNSARLSNKFGGFYFSFKFDISGLLHQVITTIAYRIRDKDTSQSKQNLQSSSMTFIHKTLIIPSVLDSCFISSTVSEVKRYSANMRRTDADFSHAPPNEYSPSPDDKKQWSLVWFDFYKIPLCTLMTKQVKTMKIQAGIQVSRPRELTRQLQLWKRFGRLYLIVFVLVRNIVAFDLETLHEMDSKSALSVIKVQFERFINSDLLKPLDIYSRSFHHIEKSYLHNQVSTNTPLETGTNNDEKNVFANERQHSEKHAAECADERDALLIYFNFNFLYRGKQNILSN